MMNRKNFIKQSAVLSIPMLLNGISLSATNPQSIISQLLSFNTEETDRVLVIIQLFGGNDGLNTILPLEQYDRYYKARSNIAIPVKKILRLNNQFQCGLHPALERMQILYNENKLSIIQGVGYPNPSLSHFSSTDIWMSGSDADHILTSGWAGRYLNTLFPGYPEGYPNTIMNDPPAIQMGQVASLLFRGDHGNMSQNLMRPDEVFHASQRIGNDADNSLRGKQLSFIRDLAEKTDIYSKIISNASEKAGKQLEYPQSDLANQLKTVASLIKGGLKTKVYLVSYDGFDTHAEQVNRHDPSTGRHAELLAVVDKAIHAFIRDLEYLKLLDRVLGVAFSEFGRRIVSNQSFGTDHGTAAPLILFGSHVKPGVFGNSPIIPEYAGPDDNLAMETDFRSIYSSVLADWMHLPQSSLAKIFTRNFEKVSLFK